uniref:Uncharacterized protein n=1 Tax=Polytomella parva TaxID=51329 RepID=A0A7S0YM02_9CHLO
MHDLSIAQTAFTNSPSGAGNRLDKLLGLITQHDANVREQDLALLDLHRRFQILEQQNVQYLPIVSAFQGRNIVEEVDHIKSAIEAVARRLTSTYVQTTKAIKACTQNEEDIRFEVEKLKEQVVALQTAQDAFFSGADGTLEKFLARLVDDRLQSHVAAIIHERIQKTPDVVFQEQLTHLSKVTQELEQDNSRIKKHFAKQQKKFEVVDQVTSSLDSVMRSLRKDCDRHETTFRDLASSVSRSNNAVLECKQKLDDVGRSYSSLGDTVTARSKDLMALAESVGAMLAQMQPAPLPPPTTSTPGPNSYASFLAPSVRSSANTPSRPPPSPGIENWDYARAEYDRFLTGFRTRNAPLYSSSSVTGCGGKRLD